MSSSDPHAFEGLSPFEIKDELIRLANEPGRASERVFLNAGRGNPNWIATRARADSVRTADAGQR